jgi:hypothetical protein
LREVVQLAWERLNVITSIIGDVQGRLIATLFYFSILVPFGIGSRLFSDPMSIKSRQNTWLERPSVPTDLESAKRQG